MQARPYYKSSSFKMAIFFTALLGGSVAVLGYFGHYFSRGHFIYGTERLIDSEIQHLLSAPDVPRAIAALGAGDDGAARAIVLLDAEGLRIAGTLPAMPHDVSLLDEGIVLFDDAAHGLSYAAKIHTFADGAKMLVGVDITDLQENYRFMQRLSVLSIVLMAVVILTSFLISTFVVSRTNRIAHTAKKIMDTGNLSQRIEIDSRWDDLSAMSIVLNEFLARLEQLVQGVQQVSDNIAHDLRTPLTRLRNHLDTLGKNPRVAADPQISATCDALIAEADHLLGTFNALLRIARIETGKQRHNFAHLHLHQLVHDVVDLYEPLAEEKKVAFILDLQPVSLEGDRDLIFQAFANLIDNALKFAPADTDVTLRLRVLPGLVEAFVEDRGIGIPAAAHAKVFERFYRIESSRHTAGNGLGLSLVAAVMSLHQGHISLHDHAPGLSVRLVFPLTTQD